MFSSFSGFLLKIFASVIRFSFQRSSNNRFKRRQYLFIFIISKQNVIGIIIPLRHVVISTKYTVKNVFSIWWGVMALTSLHSLTSSVFLRFCNSLSSEFLWLWLLSLRVSFWKRINSNLEIKQTNEQNLLKMAKYSRGISINIRLKVKS